MELPYKDSVFFPIRAVLDTCCLLHSSSSIVGINKQGMHFFTTSSEKYVRSEDLKTYFHSEYLEAYLYPNDADAVELFPDNGGAVFFQLRKKAKLRVLYFQTPLHEEFHLAVQACKSKDRSFYSHKSPVSVKREWEQETARKDAYEAVIDLGQLRLKEFAQTADRWLAMYLRFAVRQRQQTIRSEEATDRPPNKEVRLRFIESELNRMEEENENGWGDIYTRIARVFLSMSRSTVTRTQIRVQTNTSVPQVRCSSTPTLELNLCVPIALSWWLN